MRILISAYTCNPFGGSEGANAWYTAEGLARAGADVHILTRETDRENTEAGIAEYAADPGLGSLAAFYLSDTVPGPVSSGQIGVYARYAAWQARAHRWARDARHGRWDVGHHISWGSLTHPVGIAGCPFPLVVGPAGGGQSLAPEHERWLDGHAGHDRRRRVALRRLISLNPVSRYVARSAALILATNHETADLARRLGASRVDLTLAEGVRPEGCRTEPPSFPAQPNIVWIGRFLPLKAAGLAAAAFREVLRSVPDARLILVGDGPTRAEVELACSDLVREDRVEFTGQLAWADAQLVLSRARIHLFTSVRDSSSAQTLEAAALGVPTVAMDAYGCGTFLHRPGFRLVDPLPGDGLDRRYAEALIETLTWSPADWLSASEGALTFARENEYRARARDYMRIYDGMSFGGEHSP